MSQMVGLTRLPIMTKEITILIDFRRNRMEGKEFKDSLIKTFALSGKVFSP